MMKKTRVQKSRWTVPLKGLSHERGWIKSAENLGASPFKSDLLIDTTFSQINLAGQSLGMSCFDLMSCIRQQKKMNCFHFCSEHAGSEKHGKE
jgi:hypothetical protein